MAINANRFVSKLDEVFNQVPKVQQHEAAVAAIEYMNGKLGFSGETTTVEVTPPPVTQTFTPPEEQSPPQQDMPVIE